MYTELDAIAAIEAVPNWPCLFEVPNFIDSSRKETRLVLGIQREADGMTIKRGFGGEVFVHIPRNEAAFTGQHRQANETMSHMPETILQFDPTALKPLWTAQPNQYTMSEAWLG